MNISVMCLFAFECRLFWDFCAFIYLDLLEKGKRLSAMGVEECACTALLLPLLVCNHPGSLYEPSSV